MFIRFEWEVAPPIYSSSMTEVWMGFINSKQHGSNADEIFHFQLATLNCASLIPWRQDASALNELFDMGSSHALDNMLMTGVQSQIWI